MQIELTAAECAVTVDALARYRTLYLGTDTPELWKMADVVRVKALAAIARED